MIKTNDLDKDLRNTLLEAQLCYEAWWLLVSKHGRRELVVEVYNQHPQVFRLIEGTLFTALMIKLASLFGKRRDEISLHKLPGVNLHTNFRSLMEKGNILHQYRSNVFAHRNYRMSERNFAKETKFRYSDLKWILDESRSLFNFYARQNKRTPVGDISLHENWVNVFECLKQAKIQLG